MAAIRSQYCGECFELFDADLVCCPHCGASDAMLGYRDYQQKLLHALEQRLDNAVFLRAERQADGRRSFKLLDGEPLQTSFGTDLYEEIFGAATGG